MTLGLLINRGVLNSGFCSDSYQQFAWYNGFLIPRFWQEVATARKKNCLTSNCSCDMNMCR